MKHGSTDLYDCSAKPSKLHTEMHVPNYTCKWDKRNKLKDDLMANILNAQFA